MKSNLDFRNKRTVTSFLQKCQLPTNPWVQYILIEEARNMFRKQIQTWSLPDIHKKGCCPEETDLDRARNRFLETMFPLVEIDLPITLYKLGEPILPQETDQAFFLDGIDVSKVPKYQEPMLNLTHKTMTDIITLQELPLHEFRQLRGGDLISRETWKELLSRHTTTWCGQPNVGFKFGNVSIGKEEMIYGNLVSFNFDKISFFPQTPGILSIQRVANTQKVPSHEKPVRVIPEFYFLLSYKQYRFYLPDTEHGRKVLGLMKDAFKKGNLFALSTSGKVRHGRIHKKTSLRGVFGYPDETYLDRVAGELRSLGSTPFVYQFSADPQYQPEIDPYPAEKRFKIQFRK